MADSWQEPAAGFQYVPGTVIIARDYQGEKLEACGLDPALLGEVADPAFFIAEAIRAGIDSGISAEGNVNMLQSLVQHRPALLDEPLTVRGEIVAVTPVPRGRAVDTEVTFATAAGERVIIELPGQQGDAKALGCDRRLVKNKKGWEVKSL